MSAIPRIMLFLFLPVAAFPQGSLTPPGAPGPTMKTLDQVDAKLEKRIPISSLPFFANSAGSYYMTANLTGIPSADGIIINADDVTVDLNGFTLRGVSNSFSGIEAAVAVSGLVVRNGTVRDWGSHGLDLTMAEDSKIEHLSARANGGIGIIAGPRNILRECHAVTNANRGFFLYADSTADHCTAFLNGGSGLLAFESSLVLNSISKYNVGDGFVSYARSSFRGCEATGNGERGFYLDHQNVIEDCVARGNTTLGIDAGGYSYCVIKRCSAIENKQHGIVVGSHTMASENFAGHNGTTTNHSGIFVQDHWSHIRANVIVKSTGSAISLFGALNWAYQNDLADNVRNIDRDGFYSSYGTLVLAYLNPEITNTVANTYR